MGKHNNYITLIGSASNKSQWMTGEYDDALLPHLDEALKEKGKKLIMLHINGSHEIACTRYPEWADKFKTGNKYEDCYNNSILFTDYVIGEVIKRLEGSKSSLLYFSDHGTEKILIFRHFICMAQIHQVKKPTMYRNLSGTVLRH